MTSTDSSTRKISRAERERRTDAALAEGRYRIASHYSANNNSGGVVEVVNLFFCNLVNGRCEVCGAKQHGPLRSGPEPKQLPGEDDATYWKRFWRWNRESIEELERLGPEIEGCFSMTISGPPGLLTVLEDRANAEKARVR
jgi:hypothetical protein